MTTDHDQLIAGFYRSFNGRDIDALLAAMAPEVDWPNGWEGGRVTGREAVRDYWERQWAAVDPRVDPVGVVVDDTGAVDVEVHQVVRDADGAVVVDTTVHHVYRFDDDGLVTRMDIR